MKNTLKRWFWEIKKGQDRYKIDKKVPLEWIGNNHAGFYISKNALKADGTVLSFGVGEDISFDLALNQLNPKNSFHLFDPTPKSIAFIQNQNLGANFHFHSIGIADYNGKTSFLLPSNDTHVSGSLKSQNNVDESKKIEVEVKTFQTIIEENKIKSINTLKLDIEGSEYDIIEDILNSKIQIDQICIEFHTRFFPNGKELTNTAIEKLKNGGFDLVGYSYNAEEFTFLKHGS